MLFACAIQQSAIRFFITVQEAAPRRNQNRDFTKQDFCIFSSSVLPHQVIAKSRTPLQLSLKTSITHTQILPQKQNPSLFPRPSFTFSYAHSESSVSSASPFPFSLHLYLHLYLPFPFSHSFPLTPARFSSHLQPLFLA